MVGAECDSLCMAKPTLLYMYVGVGLSRAGQFSEQIVRELVAAGISTASRGELETGSVAWLGLRQRRVNAAWPDPPLPPILSPSFSYTNTHIHTHTFVFLSHTAPSSPHPPSVYVTDGGSWLMWHQRACRWMLVSTPQ